MMIKIKMVKKNLPIVGQEGEAEGDGGGGDEESVEDCKHRQDLAERQLWMITIIILVIMLIILVILHILKPPGLFIRSKVNVDEILKRMELSHCCVT